MGVTGSHERRLNVVEGPVVVAPGESGVVAVIAGGSCDPQLFIRFHPRWIGSLEASSRP